MSELQSLSSESVLPKLSLTDVRENWQQAKELPLTYQDSENIITDKSLWAWRDSLSYLSRNNLLSPDLAGKFEFNIVLLRELLDDYHRLRFLNRTNAIAGLHAIADDIHANFDPKETLMLVERGSSRFFYNLISDRLADFGVAVPERNADVITRRGRYTRASVQDAKRLVYVDDWVLSGEQLSSIVGPSVRSPEQLFTYHLVMSDKGADIYRKFGLDGRCIYKIVGDDGKDSFFGHYPIYGFHKIPDLLSIIFADSARDHDPAYTIFPPVNGEPVGRHSRLVAY